MANVRDTLEPAPRSVVTWPDHFTSARLRATGRATGMRAGGSRDRTGPTSHVAVRVTKLSTHIAHAHHKSRHNSHAYRVECRVVFLFDLNLYLYAL